MAKRELTSKGDIRLRHSRDSASTPQIEADSIGDEEHSTRSTVFNIRLPREELIALEKAASNAGLSLAEYLRKSAALHPADSVLTKPQVDLSISTPYSQYGDLVTWSESEAGQTVVKTTTEGATIHLFS